jgi:chromosome segregation protein
MRLKRLDITGFKSFMDRTVFSFDDGITAVVGPNGCGKSNVVDAIRWVMGEQSAKNLRGRGMEDVIFNGSETHAPLSMAEVTLTLTVEAPDVLPETLAGLPEVSVTRRLFRSGESEYQINKTTCRLLDITELFLGTGVGTKAYSIIEQGRVGQIVSARPEDRRSFIEEAAGITKYKARRRAAERKMESTQQNLLRVNDIVAELEKRLDSLERQARKAEKYKRLRGEMRDIELHHSSHRFLELTAGRSLLTTRLETLTADEQEKLARVQSMDADISNRREALEAETVALEAAAAEFYALESQVQLDAQNLVHWKEDLESTRARVAAAETELAEVLARKAIAEQEKLEAEGELSRLGVASREDEVALDVLEEELRRTVDLMAQVTTRLEGERRELVEVLTRVANHESNLANLDTRRADLDQRLERLTAERAVLLAEQTQLEDARREVLARVEQSRQLAIEITQRRGEEETTLQQARDAFTENEVQVLAVRDELSETRSRLQSLEEIQRNYEGFDRGVRAVMSKAGEDLRQAGIFGLVSDVVTAAPELEKAIEAALGDQLQHVIVETPERGVEYVEYLKSLGEGRSTFVPVSSDGLEVLPPLEGPEVRAMALSQVQVKDEALRGLVERLLNGVVVVHDLESARSLAGRAPKYTFVTVDGEVLRPGGVVTGGVMEGPGVGALLKKRQLAELSDEVKRLEERYQELITRHYELQKQVGQLEGVLKGLEKNRHQEELQLQGHEKDLSQAASSLVKLRERIAGLDAELSQLEATKNLLSVDLESSRGEVMHGQTDKQAREERVALLQAELESLTTKSEATRAEATALKVKVASSSERGSSARQRADALFTQVNELTERAGRLSTTKEEGAARIAELDQRLSETGAGREEREAKLAEARGGIDARKEAHAAEVAKVRDEEHQLKELRASAEGLTHELAELTLKSRELSLELEHLSSTVQERHGVAMHEAISLYHTHPQLGAEAVERLKELRAQVEKMGEVNVTAIEEHQEIAQRFEFLSKQKKDLEASLSQLTEAIKTIDETSRQRFKETFDVVNDKFQQVFPRLFGGGRASLLLTQEPGSNEPGIEILAQPPGKKLQSVNLFSGGEKALTAVALIFGIFLIKPTPFCLLDEVDAPLDEGNVGRYNDMVKEMSKTSQFILITHNKRTMEIGDTLYGVTMEEPGVSKLVAVNLKEAAANSDQQVA